MTNHCLRLRLAAAALLLACAVLPFGVSAQKKEDTASTGKKARASMKSPARNTESPKKDDAPSTDKPAEAASSTALLQGAVRPGNLVLPQMAVQFAGADLGHIIQTCLQLADIAVPPVDANAASTAAEKDRAAGAVDYDGWTVAGVSYLLRGTISGEGAEVELYDIVSRNRVFGNRYTGSPARDPRRLAHRIADDVIQSIAGYPGFFSSQVACLVSRDTRNKEVGILSPDGSGLRMLTNENALVASPAWGRKGQEVFFTSYRENNPDLYGITLDGRRFQVSRRPGLNTSPSWSESAQRLAATLAKDGNTEIYTMSADGRNLARLTATSNEVSDTAADWSPDGTQIAYTSDAAGQPQIYVMNADGSGARRVTGAGYFDSPAWSPDGKRLAFVARHSGEFNLMMLDLESNNLTQLTRGQRDNTDPSWAPGSRHLVFSSNRNGGHDLYIMNVDTRTAKQITQNGNCTSPAWGPLLK